MGYRAFSLVSMVGIILTSTAAQAAPPTYDSPKFCERSETQFGRPVSQTLIQQCIAREIRAQDEVTATWDGVASADQAMCLRMVGEAGGYQRLSACLSAVELASGQRR